MKTWRLRAGCELLGRGGNRPDDRGRIWIGNMKSARDAAIGKERPAPGFVRRWLRNRHTGPRFGPEQARWNRDG